MYEKNLHRKIMMFYEAMNWSKPVDKQFTLERFFVIKIFYNSMSFVNIVLIGCFYGKI